MRLFAVATALAVAAMLGGGSVSHAQSINCTGTVGGAATLTTINGNVIVPGGAACTLEFVDVAGNVTVQPGGSLLISSRRQSAATSRPSTAPRHCSKAT